TRHYRWLRSGGTENFQGLAGLGCAAGCVGGVGGMAEPAPVRGCGGYRLGPWRVLVGSLACLVWAGPLTVLRGSGRAGIGCAGGCVGGVGDMAEPSPVRGR